MPTDSERRRIAARLRADAGTQSMVLDYFGSREASSWRRLLDCLGDPAMDQQDAFARLADLIGPQPDRTCYFDEHGFCSECGLWYDPATNAEFRYCPQCGAKVVASV